MYVGLGCDPSAEVAPSGNLGDFHHEATFKADGILHQHYGLVIRIYGEMGGGRGWGYGSMQTHGLCGREGGRNNVILSTKRNSSSEKGSLQQPAVGAQVIVGL